MKRNVSLICLFAVICASLNGCTSPAVKINTMDNETSLQKSLAQVEGREIFLYPVKIDANGQSKGYTVNIEGKSHKFPWTGGSDDFSKMYFLDLNGDKKEELVVSLNLAHGTGLYANELHVIDPETWNEISVESPQKIIDTNVRLSHTKATMSLEVPGQTFFIKRAELKKYAPLTDDFGLVPMDCGVEDGKLVATYALNVNGVAALIGDLKIEYSFHGDGYKMSSIRAQKTEK